MKMNVCNPPQPIIEECGTGTNSDEVDFSEYMWMGEELEEFDRQVEEELWEEAFIEACFDEMMAEENNQGTGNGSNGRTRQPRQQQQNNTNNNNYQRQQGQTPPSQHHQQYVYDNNMANIEDSMKMFGLGENKVNRAEVVKNSCLNPEAPEFVPGNFMKR